MWFDEIGINDPKRRNNVFGRHVETRPRIVRETREGIVTKTDGFFVKVWYLNHIVMIAIKIKVSGRAHQRSHKNFILKKVKQKLAVEGVAVN